MLLASVTLTGLCQATDPDRPDALEVIESTRGGRHWIDKETDPPRSPEATLQSLNIEDGYSISLFASEPLVRDPVAICFDPSGKMYAIEYGDYPTGPPEGEPPLSKIVVLEDTDNDSVADRRTVFADHLDFAHSIMPYRGGLLVGAKTKVIHLVDTDGDLIADQTTTLMDGFTPAHPQMQVGNPRYGIDNWVYFNYGPGEIRTDDHPDTITKLPRKDFRYHPQTKTIEPDSGMGQFGNTIDRWGRRFYCTNRNPIITTFLSTETLRRNPFLVILDASYDVAPSGGESRVYPAVTMKSNYLSHAGTHTSACGTTAYLGPFGTESFRNSVFVCEPIGHLVTRSEILSDGLELKAVRGLPDSDFLTSTDTWFRPSSLATGPDGALYLADMYRLWVEHPKFLPPEIAAKMDWRAGDDRGRIYRIVPTGTKLRPYNAPKTADDLVAMLQDDNAWARFTAQRLLVEENDPISASLVRPLLDHPQPMVRSHAMWTLHGLNSIRLADLQNALQDDHPVCRVNALRIAEMIPDRSKLEPMVLAIADDSSMNVRFQLGLFLGTLPDSDIVLDSLVQLAIRDGSNHRFADGLLTSLGSRSAIVLHRLLNVTDGTAPTSTGKLDLLKRLAEIVGARGDEKELSQVLDLFSEASSGGEPESNRWSSAIITGLAKGLTRYRGPFGRMSLSRLTQSPPENLSVNIDGLTAVLKRSRQVAIDESASTEERLSAIELLSLQSSPDDDSIYKALLNQNPSISIQTATVRAMGQSLGQDRAKLIIESWSDLSPTVQSEAMAMLFRRTDTTVLALQAIQENRINASGLSLDQRVRLLKHGDESIRALAIELFGGAVSANRQQVAKEYQPALTSEGNRHEGELVFKRVCASCHKVNGQGLSTGPDLSDAKNRSKAALLYDILDPNSKVEPRFAAYTVLTVDGNVLTGLIAEESDEAIVLKMAEGKSQTIGRAEIEAVKASEVSLMPEGIEKEITTSQMADLLEYLTAR